MVECNEEYTTKTCSGSEKSATTQQHYNITRNKGFKCPTCDLKMDRDVNAA